MGVLTLKAAKTKINLERDWALRKAEELIKAASKSGTVKLDFKTRVVTVDGTEAFAQSSDDLGGTFLAPFAGL